MTTRPLIDVRGPLKLGLLLAGAVLVTSCGRRSQLGSGREAGWSGSGRPRSYDQRPALAAGRRDVGTHDAGDTSSGCRGAGSRLRRRPPTRPYLQVLPGALPIVTIRAVGDGSVLIDDGGPCSNLQCRVTGTRRARCNGAGQSTPRSRFASRLRVSRSPTATSRTR